MPQKLSRVLPLSGHSRINGGFWRVALASFRKIWRNSENSRSQRQAPIEESRAKKENGACNTADGLALGFISYAVVKAFSGRALEISWLTYLLAIVLVVYFVFVRSRMG